MDYSRFIASAGPVIGRALHNISFCGNFAKYLLSNEICENKDY